MNRLAVWWRKVFGEPAPMEYSAMAQEKQDIEIPPDRMAVIDDLTQRQHAQANEITAETGRAYITKKRQEQARKDGEAIHKERQFWERMQGT